MDLTDLAARVAALEADRCLCESCKHARKDAEANRERDRAYAVLNLPDDERNAWIGKASYTELHHAAKVWGDRLVEVAVAAPADLQPVIMAHTTSTHLRAQFDVLSDERRGMPIAWVRVRAMFIAGNLGGRVGVPDIETGEALHLAGVRVRRDDKGLYFSRDALMPGGCWEYRAAEWRARLAADADMRAAIADGVLVVDDIPRDHAVKLEVQARTASVKQRYVDSKGIAEPDAFSDVEAP